MISSAMGKVLDRLLLKSPVRRVSDDDGLNLYPIDGHQDEFDALVRQLEDEAGNDYVAFPCGSGPHYEHVLVLPLSE